MKNILLSLLLLTGVQAYAAVHVTHLSVEGRQDQPLGLDVATPRLGWQLVADAAERDVRQTAYHIRVASHPDTLAAGRGDLWDVTVPSDQSLWVDYQGQRLTVNQRAYWQVQVTYTTSAAKRGKTLTTDWSPVTSWGAGLLGETNWRGNWIGFDYAMPWDIEDLHSSLSARYYRTVFNAKGKQVRHATLHIAGLGLYEAYVNGHRVGAAPTAGSHVGKQVLAPAPTDYRRSVIYNSYDVTEMLTPAADLKNCLAVTVSGGRYYTMQQKKKLYKIANFGYPTLRANLFIEYTDGTRDVIATNEKAWRMTADGPIRKSNEYDGETYDARRVFTTPGSSVRDNRLHWTLADYDDSQWLAPERSAIPVGISRGNTTPPMQVQEVLRPKHSLLTSDGRLMLDFGQNFAGWMRVPVGRLGLHEGDTLVLRFAEKLEAPIGLPWTAEQSAQSNGPGYCLTDTARLYLDNLRLAEVTDRYIANGHEPDDQTWAPRFTYHGFRFAEITVNGRPLRLNAKQQDAVLSKVEGEVIGDPMETLYTFNSANALLNRILQNAFWGIRSNYKGMPVDCPQRDERQPWVGDHSMGCWGESYMMDNHALYLKWMQDLEDSQRGDGSLPGVAPAFWNYYNDDVSWPSVFLFAADMLYTQYGDVEAMRRHYPAMRRWVMHFWNEHRDAATGIIHADKYADWCCPPEAPELIHSADPNRITDGDLIGSCYLYKMMELMMRFDSILVAQQGAAGAEAHDLDAYARQGLTPAVLLADRAEYEAIRHQLRDAINRRFLVVKTRPDDPTAGRAPNTMTGPGNHLLYPDSVYYSNNSVTANLLPLAFGIVPDEHAATVERWVIRKHLLLPGDTPELKSVDGHIQCGVIGMSWLLRGLAEMGRQDVAYMLATVSSYPGWGYMAQHGATTIWELWNGDTANPRMNSGNHIMLLGDLIPWCMETIGGIQSAAPGFRTVRMAPNFELEELPNAEASYLSPYGRIVSRWQKSDRQITWHIEVPCNAQAEVVLPYNAVTYSIAQTKQQRIKTSSQRQPLTLGSGTYDLTVQLDPALPLRDFSKGGAYERQYADSLLADRQGILCDEFLYDWRADGSQPGLSRQEVTPFPSCHSATVAELPNGDLLAAFFGGSREGGPDVCIYTARKARGQQGWQPLQLVANGDLRADATRHDGTPIDSLCTSDIVINQNRKACYNPVLFQIPGGDLLLFYKIGKNVKDWTGYLMRSSDGGHTWRGQRQRLVPAAGQSIPADSLLGAIKNQPVWLPKGFRCADGTVLAQGRIVAPTSKEDGKWRCYMEVSDDQGETWQLTRDIPAAANVRTIQPAILVHRDGRLQILCRTAKPKFEQGDTPELARIATSWSMDGGLTWSPMELIADLPNNNSGIGAVTMPDGTFALVYNPFAVVDGPDKPLRNPTCIATSADGLHWQHRLTLESSPISQYSYPSLLMGSDGTLHAIYTWRRQNIKYQQVKLK